MGMAHGLDTLVHAAESLQKIAIHIIAFLLVGEGADKERIRKLSEERGLRKSAFVDQQPRERIPAFIAASDACLVLLKKTELFKTVIPTKMLEFMACARPVIFGVEGQAREILDEAQAGMAIEPEKRTALGRSDQSISRPDDLCEICWERMVASTSLIIVLESGARDYIATR